MKFVEIDEKNEDIFFRCMHMERPVDARIIKLRKSWYEKNKKNGLRAKVLIRDDNEIVGMCQYIPIEHSIFLGENLFAIICIAVHGYEHLVGDQQGKGYGRFMLEAIEKDAKNSGALGIAACDYGDLPPKFNAIPFYLKMGYSKADKVGPVDLVWKAFSKDAKAPSLLRQKLDVEKNGAKPILTVFKNCSCNIGCHNLVSTWDAAEGIQDKIEYKEIDSEDQGCMLTWGISEGVFLNGVPYGKFDVPWNAEDLRKDIIKTLDSGI